MKNNKGCIELSQKAKFYKEGPPILFVNNQEVGPIIKRIGETFEETQDRMAKEYILNTPGMEKYIRLIEKREEHNRSK